MKTYCEDYLSKNHSKLNVSQDISCCLFLLIEKYNEANNNQSRKDFSFFLLHTLNYYLKDKNYKISELNDLFLNKEQISLSLFSKFLNILIHYSFLYINFKKVEYAKFILSLGVDIINKSDFKTEKKIIRKKVALANNIACLYLSNNNFIKAELFLEKCKQKSLNSLDKLIIYNNCCIIIIKKMNDISNNLSEIHKIVDNILKYLNIIFNDINKGIEKKYQTYLTNEEYKDENIKLIDKNKNELFCFIIFNCLKMMKTFIKKQFDKNYSNLFIFIQKILGNQNFITLKMKRLDNNKNDFEFFDLLINDNFNDIDLIQANKDIITYMKKNNNKEDIEEKKEVKSALIIEKATNLEIKNIDSNFKKKKDNKENINNEKNINNNNINPEDNKEEIIDKNNNTNFDKVNNSKSNEGYKKSPQAMNQKKTWKGLFNTIISKKLPGQDNKLSELFKSISQKSNNIKLEFIKSQYNKYHEEMILYLKDRRPDNYFKFNENYSTENLDELIICILDENDEEKNKFNKVEFEKSLQRSNSKRLSSDFVINYFKNSIRKKIIFPELISDILDYNMLENMNNLYNNKKKNELSINKELERIINHKNVELIEDKNIKLIKDNEAEFSFTSKSPITNKIETEFYLDIDKYKISFINDYENKNILITASKSKKSQSKKDIKDESNISKEIKYKILYNDLNYYYSKYYSKKNYEFCINLRYLQDINEFIQRILVHYIRLIKVNDQIKLALCNYPKGNFKKVNKKGRPEFNFLNEICTFELCKYNKRFELNIYNTTYKSNLRITLELDFSSESVFFHGKNKKSKSSSKVSADFEYNPNYKIFTRFANLFIKLEKIFQFRDKNIKTFSEYAKKYESNIHKICCTDSIINLDLWIISLQKNEVIEENEENNNNSIDYTESQDKKVQFEWKVELYTLTKLAIKNGSFYINKNIILSQLDFENILGCDYSDIYKIINDRDNQLCLYFLLGTIGKMKHLLIKMLNSSNYLTAFRLQKINPISFFKYKFVFKHIKRYFICSLEFLIYSRENFFLRIMVMETLNNRSYSKIYIPFYTIKIEFDFKEMEKFLIQKYDAINNLYQDKEKLKKFLLKESQNLLKKNSSTGVDSLILFENIEFLVEKIKIFLSEK